MFILDLKSRIPIYEQLKNSTLELILCGVLKPNSPMPSIRSLAKDLGVNPNTIQKAYQEMERDGIIYSVVGKGSFISDTNNANTINITSSLEKLEKSAYEARLYGVTLEQAIEQVKKAYERGVKND